MSRAAKFHLGLIIFWTILTPVSFLTGLANQTAFITLLSLVALILASGGAYQAARVGDQLDTKEDK